MRARRDRPSMDWEDEQRRMREREEEQERERRDWFKRRGRDA